MSIEIDQLEKIIIMMIKTERAEQLLRRIDVIEKAAPNDIKFQRQMLALSKEELLKEKELNKEVINEI